MGLLELGIMSPLDVAKLLHFVEPSVVAFMPVICVSVVVDLLNLETKPST